MPEKTDLPCSCPQRSSNILRQPKTLCPIEKELGQIRFLKAGIKLARVRARVECKRPLLVGCGALSDSIDQIPYYSLQPYPLADEDEDLLILLKFCIPLG